VTLIVSAVVGNWAFHASDRFVSVDPTPDNPTGEYDPHANKTVVVVGTDCWVVLGYTGIAYLDGKPTDQLIAEAISGYDELPPAMSTFWQRPPNLHYREIRNRVEAKLKDAYTRLSESEKRRATLVSAAGVQEKDSLVTKVMFRMTVVGDTATSVELRPDTQQFNAFYIDAVGMVHNPTIDRAKARLSAITGSAEEVPDTVREILKDAVLETSTLTNKVGDNVMTVVLDNPGQAIRTGLHITDRQRQADLFETARQQQPDMLDQFAHRLTVSTPYVLMPGNIWGPSIGNPGGWVVNNEITFDYTGFDDQPGSGSGAFFGVQPRRDWP
jgi:hypothetical protein